MDAKSMNSVLVLRNDDTSAWESSEKILKKGELALEYQEDGTVKIKAGNDKDKFSNLNYVGSDVKPAQVFQVELGEGDVDDIAAIEAHIESLNETREEAIELSIGDMAIVKAGIVGDHKSYTSYVYDGNTWVATDGNYSADNVFLKENITLAGEYTRVGNLTKSSNNSTGTFATAGLSIADALKKIFTATLQPKITANPAVTTKLNDNTGDLTYEVGTSFTPTYSASLSSGSYTYGPATGITAKSWSVSDSDGNTSTTASGTFPTFVIDDDTSYVVTATASYDAGAVATDNLGDPSNPTIQIGGGSKSDASGTVTGYRAWFYGYKNGDNTVDVSALDSAEIRKLTAANGSIPATITTNKMQQMIFAIPASKNKTGIAVANSTNGAPQTVSGPVTVSVEGANGHTAVDYDVWYVSNASAESGSTTFNITVS